MGRQKPGKPRRERPESTEHSHEGFEIPEGFEHPGGRPVDNKLLGDLVGAAYDGCTTCQDPLLTLLVEDPTTTARLVELTCVAVHQAFGGLPAGMTDADAPGQSTPEFRRLARAGMDGANESMFQECEQMDAEQRRAAANTALDTLVGQIALGG